MFGIGKIIISRNNRPSQNVFGALNEDCFGFCCSSLVFPMPPYIVASTDFAFVTTVPGLDYTKGNGPSMPSSTFKISALGLSPSSGNITVTPSANFEVFDGSSWVSSPFNIAYSSGSVTTATIYKIRLKAGLAVNSYSETVVISGADAVDWDISVSGSVAFAFESQTIAFMNAIGIPFDSTVYFASTPYQITGINYWNYLNDFVLNIKGQGTVNSTVNLLGRFKALYPLIGGTAFTTKFNLINPVDSDAAFRISWFGGLIFSGNGVLSNNTDGYGNTHLIPNVDLLLNDVHDSAYYVQNQPSSAGYLMGVVEAFADFRMRRTGSPQLSLDNSVNSFPASSILCGGGKLAMLSRDNHLTFDSYDDNTGQSVTANSQFLSQYEFALMGLNNNGTFSSFTPDTEFKMFSIGTSMNATEQNLWYLSVVDFQTKLNRT